MTYSIKSLQHLYSTLSYALHSMWIGWVFAKIIYSLLVGLNIVESWLNEAASILNCKVGRVPFLYLGLFIGGDPRRLAFWDPVLNSIKARLSGWQSRFLSFGGQLVLLKSVLTALPVYALSFFKALSGSVKGHHFCLAFAERQVADQA